MVFMVQRLWRDGGSVRAAEGGWRSLEEIRLRDAVDVRRGIPLSQGTTWREKKVPERVPATMFNFYHIPRIIRIWLIIRVWRTISIGYEPRGRFSQQR